MINKKIVKIINSKRIIFLRVVFLKHSRVTHTKNKAFFGIFLKEKYKTYDSNFSHILINTHVNI